MVKPGSGYSPESKNSDFGVRPDLSPAEAVMVLKVDPGGYSAWVARLMSG